MFCYCSAKNSNSHIPNLIFVLGKSIASSLVSTFLHCVDSGSSMNVPLVLPLSIM